MKPSYWVSQSKDKPLFPELEWSRPENRLHAGKLLVIGGNLHGFAAPAEAYGYAERARAGTVRALLPDSIRKIVGIILPEAHFAPSTRTSGSFGQKALADFLESAAWADGVLVAGDLGRNSETAILLEAFLGKHSGQVTLAKDAVDYAASAPQSVLERPDTLLVLSFAQLQRLAVAAKYPEPVKFSMDLLHLAEWLHNFTAAHSPSIVVKHLNHILVAINGQVSSTVLAEDTPIWRIRTAATASVWWMQNPSRPFDAITASLVA